MKINNMAFTPDDKEYLGLLINPIKDDVTELKNEFKKHDNQTNKIDLKQSEMVGMGKILLWMVVPVIVGVITWYLTKG